MHSSDSDFASRGPYAVGVIQTTIPYAADDGGAPDAVRQLPTEIWYPASPDQPQRDDAAHPLGLLHRATTGLPPIEAPSGPCPLVAFSHGNSGLRQQSTFLMTHLASWGIVVAAPDHVGNTFSEMMALPDQAARQATHRRVRGQRPHDLHAVIQALLDGDLHSNEIPDLDATRLGVLGHSFGGWTALKVTALERRVRAVCGLAPASEPFVGRKAFAPDELPLAKEIATLILAGRDDVLVDLETSIHPLFDRLGAQAKLEIIDRADHFHFCDGIELLHKMHESNPREGQHQATRPFADLRDERDMHALLNERVTRFFAEAF